MLIDVDLVVRISKMECRDNSTSGRIMMANQNTPFCHFSSPAVCERALVPSSHSVLAQEPNLLKYLHHLPRLHERTAEY